MRHFRNTALQFALVIPFVFSSVAFKANNRFSQEQNSSLVKSDCNENEKFDSYLKSVYNNCQLEDKGLSYSVFEKATTGYFNLKQCNKAIQKNIIAIVDFQKPSSQKRLWIVDLKNQQLLYNTLVAHGKNTGEDKAINFSNVTNSNMSSLGFYYTDNTYHGKHGLSLVLEGVDMGFNTNAKSRSIVMHAADYVSEKFVQCNGRLGRSHGCPALPPEKNKEIIDLVKGGSVLFIHYPSSDYHSVYLNKSKAVEQFSKENEV